MFQRDKNNANNKQGDNNGGIDAPPLKPFTSKETHAPTKPPTKASNLAGDHSNVSPQMRHADVPLAPNRPSHLDHYRQGEADSKRLVIGRNIRLSGEITACERLIVEGHVEVTLTGARLLEVTSSGFFKGSAQVDEAIISGHIDGDLTVNNKLIVRAGGKICGSVRYGSIIIESGGEVSGDMHALDTAPKDSGPE